MKKISTILIILVILVAFNTLTNIAQLTRKSVILEPIPLGGSTAGDWGVGGNLTITGTSTFVSQLNADGGLVIGGSVYDFGTSPSTSITAEMLCPGTDGVAYNFFTIDVFEFASTSDILANGVESGSGASISFSDDETFTAITGCIENQGDSLRFTIDPTASTSTAYVDLVTSGLVYNWVSASYNSADTQKIIDFNGGWLLDIEVMNVDGSSLAWEFTPKKVSISFQD